MKQEEEVYLDLNRSVIVYKSGVKVSDLGDVLCKDKVLQRKIGELVVFQMSEYKEKVQVVSALKVIEVILKSIENVTVRNIGEADTVVILESQKQGSGGNKNRQRCLDIAKIVLVCLILFFGAAFSIMSFHTDVSIQNLFGRLYYMLTGDKSNHFTVLEVCYSIGIFLGVIVFFNHFGKKKVTHDPTPVQVQMREYEKTVDDTFIENLNRKGTKINVE